MDYARMLRAMRHCIEAERLGTKLVTIIRHIHSPNHKSTIEADQLLAEVKGRYVSVLPNCKLFQALRNENDEEISVVCCQGPSHTAEAGR